MSEKVEKVNDANGIHNFQLRVPESMFQQLDEAHWSCRMSINQLIIEAIREFLSELSVQDQEEITHG